MLQIASDAHPKVGVTHANCNRVNHLNLVAHQGFEPQYAAPEAAVLPLNEWATTAICGMADVIQSKPKPQGRIAKANPFIIRGSQGPGQTFDSDASILKLLLPVEPGMRIYLNDKPGSSRQSWMPAVNKWGGFGFIESKRADQATLSITRAVPTCRVSGRAFSSGKATASTSSMRLA